MSTDSRVEIKIEDHYYDQTDAAVVFRLRHHSDGATRYMYHGNDGTTFAWNDTAQLDYSKAYVREQVIQTILHVAKLFPIIRFDAAMVLAKRHVQRLWFPLPGAGGSIPSRAENAMSQEDFDAMMPAEFWREVVDRVAVEVPGTLLLAEAFWMLEGYFVRTLGMHRVYNSAFMNMLRDEENAKYRSYLKKTIEFDPDILKRYVNFMSNPDERTAIDQFGSGDKCFGVATLMSTLPGLPMFGHGQIEGYGERYGMEFKQAKMDEWPNEGLVARHQAEIAPLLKRRYIFAESANFVMYDFWNNHGGVDENVFAYSNNFHGERSLVIYNNAYASTSGTVHGSVAYMDKGAGQMRQRSLGDALSLPWDDGVIVGYRDHAKGLEYLRRASDFQNNGLRVDLRGYQYLVLLDWRELRSTAESPWDRLCDALHGEGVVSLDAALAMLRLRPLHEALRNVLSPSEVAGLCELAASGAETKGDARLASFAQKGEAFFAIASELLHIDVVTHAAAPCSEMLAGAMKLPAVAKTFSTVWPPQVQSVLPSADGEQKLWAPVLAWVLLRCLPLGEDRAAAFDKLQLRQALAEIFANAGFEGESAWINAARVRTLLAFETTAGSEAFWADGDVRWLMGVNESDGKTWINKERFEETMTWMHLAALVAGKPLKVIEADVAAKTAGMAAAGYNLDVQLAATKKPEAVAVKKAVAKKAVAKKAPAEKVKAEAVAPEPKPKAVKKSTMAKKK